MIIFIVGNSRSGTTLLSRALGKHSKIYRFKELHFYEGSISDPSKPISKDDAATILSKMLWKEREEFLSKVDLNKYLSEAKSLLSDWPNQVGAHELFGFFLKYITESSGKTIPCEQTPRNIFFAESILKNNPDALVVNMVRDPRAIMLSQKNKWKINKFNGFDVPIANTIRLFFNYHPIIVTRLWKSAVNIGRNLEHHPRFLTIKFEEFLIHPEIKLKEICQKIEVDFEEEMLDIDIAGSSFKEDYKKRGFDTSKIDKWRHSSLKPTEIIVCQKMVKTELKHFNYELVKSKYNLFSMLLVYFILPIKVFISILLNLTRNKNIFSTIKRRFLHLK